MQNVEKHLGKANRYAITILGESTKFGSTNNYIAKSSICI